jgi:CRP-like cAMP-binding protein
MAKGDDLVLKEEILKKQACFSELTAEETHVLASLLSEKQFKAGETIVTEGDLVDSVYLIVSGFADVQHVTIKNEVLDILSLATLSPGDAIGLNEQGFYSLSGVRTATVVAKTDMVLLRLSVPAFHGFALSYPHVNEVMRRNAETMLDINP